MRVRRNQRAVLDEFAQQVGRQARQFRQFFDRHFGVVQPLCIGEFGFHFPSPVGKAARGLNCEASANSLNSFFSFSVGEGGMTICAIANRSPSPSRRFGNPRFASLSFCPVFVPAGTLRRTGPASVGTSTLAPSAASHGASGRSR